MSFLPEIVFLKAGAGRSHLFSRDPGPQKNPWPAADFRLFGVLSDQGGIISGAHGQVKGKRNPSFPALFRSQETPELKFRTRY